MNFQSSEEESMADLTGKVKFRKEKKNPWQLVKYEWLFSDLLQALKGEPLSSGFSTVGSLICFVCSAALRLGVGGHRLRRNDDAKI